MAPTLARLLAFFALIILFFSTTVSFLTSNSNGYQLTAFDYLSIALGPVLGLAALAIARDLQRLTVFTILIITTLFLPISAFLPPGSDSHSETLLRIFALNLFSLVLLIEMVVGPSSIPFINVGPEVEQPYNISQSKLIATLISFMLSWVGLGDHPEVLIPLPPFLTAILNFLALIPAGISYIVFSLAELYINKRLYPEKPDSNTF